MARVLRAFFAAELRALSAAEPLWKVFWVYGVLFSSGIAVLYLAALQQELFVIQQALLIFLGGYTAWVLAAIWRCADNSSPLWATLARALTIAWAGNAILLLMSLQVDLLKMYTGR